ncbi:MAG: HEAT repeat domain-containing protein, partial [Longimicrobiales bacterium]
ALTWATLIVAAVLAVWSLYLRSLRNKKPARRKALAEFWRPALLDVLMQSVSPESLWALVRNGEELVMVNFLLQHCRRLSGKDRDRIQLLASPYLPRVVAQLQHSSPERRARAIQTLGELGLDKWSDEVVGGLEDPSPFVAMVAASTLAREQSASHVDAVLENLSRFVHWQHDFLASMLASFGPEAASSIRSKLGAPDTSPRMKAVIMDALAHLNDADAADAAYRILEEGAEPDLESACLRLLARVGTGAHLEAVCARLDSKSYPVRLTAARALGRIGGRSERPRLREIVLSDSSPWVAINAGRALLEAGGRSALRELAGSRHRRSLVARQILAEAR